METVARDAYLEMQLLTAAPQKLRLMLIDGAMRYARRTIQLWDEQNNDEACEALVRCREIVTELLGSLRIGESPLVQQVAEVYTYLFRTLTEAQRHRDRKMLNNVISVLEVERETWQQVCFGPLAEQASRELSKKTLPVTSETTHPGGLCVDA